MNSTIEKSAKKIPWLAGIFVAQLALAVVLFNTGKQAATPINEPLLTFDSAAVNKLEIVGEGETLLLQKNGAQWQLGEDLPVPNERMTEILKLMADLRTGWPVANTKDAHKRFQVTDDSFVRKIRLLHDDKELAMMYLGNAPSFRSVHLRAAGSEEIHALKFDDTLLPMSRDAWLDPNLLRPKGDILALQVGERKVSKTDGQWPSAAPAAEAPAVGAEQPAPAAAVFDSAAFAKALEEITVLGVADQEAEFDAPVTANPAAQDDKSLLKLAWTVTTSEGSYEYQLLGKQEQYYLRRNDNDHSFRISKAQYDALLKIQELQVSANS
jgi:hypothetical protein